jgi:hypothetical protein
MQRVLVHGHQTEPGIVELSDGPSWPMLKNLAYLKFLEITAKGHELISIPKDLLASLRLYTRLQHVQVDLISTGTSVDGVREQLSGALVKPPRLRLPNTC